MRTQKTSAEAIMGKDDLLWRVAGSLIVYGAAGEQTFFILESMQEAVNERKDVMQRQWRLRLLSSSPLSCCCCSSPSLPLRQQQQSLDGAAPMKQSQDQEQQQQQDGQLHRHIMRNLSSNCPAAVVPSDAAASLWGIRGETAADEALHTTQQSPLVDSLRAAQQSSSSNRSSSTNHVTLLGLTPSASGAFLFTLSRRDHIFLDVTVMQTGISAAETLLLTWNKEVKQLRHAAALTAAQLALLFPLMPSFSTPSSVSPPFSGSPPAAPAAAAAVPALGVAAVPAAAVAAAAGGSSKTDTTDGDAASKAVDAAALLPSLVEKPLSPSKLEDTCSTQWKHDIFAAAAAVAVAMCRSSVCFHPVVEPMLLMRSNMPNTTLHSSSFRSSLKVLLSCLCEANACSSMAEQIDTSSPSNAMHNHQGITGLQAAAPSATASAATDTTTAAVPFTTTTTTAADENQKKQQQHQEQQEEEEQPEQHQQQQHQQLLMLQEEELQELLPGQLSECVSDTAVEQEISDVFAVHDQQQQLLAVFNSLFQRQRCGAKELLDRAASTEKHDCEDELPRIRMKDHRGSSASRVSVKINTAAQLLAGTPFAVHIFRGCCMKVSAAAASAAAAGTGGETVKGRRLLQFISCRQTTGKASAANLNACINRMSEVAMNAPTIPSVTTTCAAAAAVAAAASDTTRITHSITDRSNSPEHALDSAISRRTCHTRYAIAASGDDSAGKKVFYDLINPLKKEDDVIDDVFFYLMMVLLLFLDEAAEDCFTFQRLLLLAQDYIAVLDALLLGPFTRECHSSITDSSSTTSINEKQQQQQLTLRHFQRRLGCCIELLQLQHVFSLCAVAAPEEIAGTTCSTAAAAGPSTSFLSSFLSSPATSSTPATLTPRSNSSKDEKRQSVASKQLPRPSAVPNTAAAVVIPSYGVSDIEGSQQDAASSIRQHLRRALWERYLNALSIEQPPVDAASRQQQDAHSSITTEAVAPTAASSPAAATPTAAGGGARPEGPNGESRRSLGRRQDGEDVAAEVGKRISWPQDKRMLQNCFGVEGRSNRGIPRAAWVCFLCGQYLLKEEAEAASSCLCASSLLYPETTESGVLHIGSGRTSVSCSPSFATASAKRLSAQYKESAALGNTRASSCLASIRFPGQKKGKTLSSVSNASQLKSQRDTTSTNERHMLVVVTTDLEMQQQQQPVMMREHGEVQQQKETECQLWQQTAEQEEEETQEGQVAERRRKRLSVIRQHRQHHIMYYSGLIISPQEPSLCCPVCRGDTRQVFPSGFLAS